MTPAPEKGVARVEETETQAAATAAVLAEAGIFFLAACQDQLCNFLVLSSYAGGGGGGDGSETSYKFVLFQDDESIIVDSADSSASPASTARAPDQEEEKEEKEKMPETKDEKEEEEKEDEEGINDAEEVTGEDEVIKNKEFDLKKLFEQKIFCVGVRQKYLNGDMVERIGNRCGDPRSQRAANRSGFTCDLRSGNLCSYPFLC